MDFSDLVQLDNCNPSHRFRICCDGLQFDIGWDKERNSSVVWDQEHYYLLSGTTLRDALNSLGFTNATISKKLQRYDEPTGITTMTYVRYKDCISSSLNSSIQEGCEWDNQFKNTFNVQMNATIVYEIQ